MTASAAPATPATERRYRGRSGEERRADRRERLLDAGLDLFGTQGYPGTSIESLCAVAGISTRNFYEEFRNREALLIALHDFANATAMDSVTRALAAADPADAAARATAAAQAFVDAMTPDPRWSRIAYIEIVGISPDMEARRRAWMERWAQVIAAEGAQLSARGLAPDRDFALTAVGLVGAINELVADWLFRASRPPIDAVVAEIVRLLVAGLSAP